MKNTYRLCKTCNRPLTIIGACIACRSQEGYNAYKNGKRLSDNPYEDEDKRAWISGWHDALDLDDQDL